LNKTRIILPSAVAIAAIVGISIFFLSPITDQENSQDEPLKIAINVWPGYSHAFIAEEMGLFEKNNVEVELILKEEYSDAQQVYIDGDSDGIFEVFSDTIFHNFNDIETKIVYVADYSASGDVIIGTGNSLSEMKGKKIGVEGFNSFSHIFVLKALENVGLLESDVEFVNVPAHDVLRSLEAGEISAGHTWEPTKSKAIDKNYKILAEAGDVPGIITDVLSFNTKVMEQRPDDIQAVVKSLLEAHDFIVQNREEAIRIMSTATDMNPDEMDEGINGVYHLSLEDNLNAMKMSSEPTSLYNNGAFIAKFYWERGQINEIPDFDEIIEPKFVMQLQK